jgi:outer membrane protein assembly factor BamB
MATLEVHDGRGHVRRVEVTREHPALFGSNPRCDIVLEGAGVLPFHGRVRWKTNRFKADASPEAEYLLINGHKMTSASFRQGDEIEVGPCRIFMLRADDDLPGEDDKTRVHPMPVYAPPPGRGRFNWSRDLPMGRMQADAAVAEPEKREEPEDQPRGRPVRDLKEKVSGGWGGLWRTLTAGDRPPGQERILSSPLVIGLIFSLALLGVMGIALRGVIARTTMERLFNRANESLEEGDYRTAIRRFDEFLAANSDTSDDRVGKAKVFRALANVRQFTSTTGASWTNALEAERNMVQQVGKERVYRDVSTELAELVIRTGEELADRARAGADAEALAQAESTVALHARVAGKSAEALLKKSRLPGKLAEARAAVRKAHVRRDALAAMDDALKAGSSAGVYKARDALVLRYADLAQDREVLSRMTKANELIRRGVKFDPSRRPAETGANPEPFGPPTSLVLRAASTDKRSVAPAGGPVVFALADGYVYGIDGASGTPLWQVPVGLSSPFAPLPVPGGTAALVVDSRHDELLRLDGRTGALLWRQGLDEPVVDPPLVLGNQVIQPTPGGRLILLDLKSGERQGTVDLGMKRPGGRDGDTERVVAAKTPASDEAGQFLYVPADKDCLFVLKRDPPACAAVEYLGHAAGSLPCPPARLGRYLVVPENHELVSSRWRVFVLDEEGARVRPVQQLTFPGWLWDPPATSGSVVWSVGDRGSVSALAVGSYEEKNPFRPLAKIEPDARTSGPAFALAKSERELWVASGRSSRYDLDAEQGTLKAGWALADAGPALAPVQAAGPLMVLTQQFTEGPGVALWGVDPKSGSIVWKTVLGTPWPLPLAEAREGEGLTTLSVDGRAVAVTRSQLAAGGFLEVRLPRAGSFRLPQGRLRRLDGDGLSVIIPGPDANYLLARAGDAEFRRTELPTPLGAAPVLWGKDVLVPGSDGRAYLVDPLTGESRAEPYVPVFDRAHPIRWRDPVRVDGDAVVLADESGLVRRLTRPTSPRPRLVASAEVNLKQGILTDPASTGGAVVLATADDRLRALSARDLSPAGAWPLEVALAVPPVAVTGRCFLADKAGGILALGPEGQRLWSSRLRDSVAAGPPVVKDQAAWFLARDGSLQRLNVADGAVLDRIELGVLPAGGLRTAGPDLVVPVASGTVRVLSPKALAAGGGSGQK